MAGSEQGIEAGQVGLRLITKGDRQTTVAKEWSISATSIADGRFELFLYYFITILQYCGACALVLFHGTYSALICFPLCFAFVIASSCCYPQYFNYNSPSPVFHKCFAGGIL